MLQLGRETAEDVVVRSRLSRFVVVLIALMFSVSAWIYTAPGRGRLSARFDLWRGHYHVLAYVEV